MNKPEDKPKFIDAAELCKELGICDRTLLNWINKGIFPKPLRLNIRRRIWLRVNIDQFFEAKAVEAAEEVT